MHALDKLFLQSQPLADRRRAVFHCKQTIGQKMSQLITEKENKRFAANTADMTQEDFLVIAILEMCTDPELSKRFREVKTNELTWEKLRDVAETYERATASDNRAMMVNSNRRNGRKNQSTQGTSTKQCYRCNRKGHAAKDSRTNKEKLYCKFCIAKGHVSEACKKEKAKSNGNQKSGNTHKARQITDVGTPELTDDESNDHKVGRTIVTCSDGYKVYHTTGEDGEDQEPTDEVYRTIEGSTRKTSITPPLLL